METEQKSEALSSEAEVIEANVLFYKQGADKYDRYETCVSDRFLQDQLLRDVCEIERLSHIQNRTLKCLDCGGGSGNLSLKLLRKGWSVTSVDISAEMLTILEEKAGREGFRPRLINMPVCEFFRSTKERFDLVAFSSVLHHLYNYLEAVDRAAEHVDTGGIFYSNFDPVIAERPRLRSVFETADTLLAKALYDRSDLIPGIVRRVCKCFAEPNERHARTVVSPGDLAEYYARIGLDETAIKRTLEKQGLEIWQHVRWTWGRTPLMRHINRYLRLMQSFKIIARRSLA